MLPSRLPSSVPSSTPTGNPTGSPTSYLVPPTAEPSTDPTIEFASAGLETNLTDGDTLSQLGWVLVAFAAGALLLSFGGFWLCLRHCAGKQAKQDVDMLSGITPGLTPVTTRSNMPGASRQTEGDIV